MAQNEECIGQFRNAHQEKYEIWIKDNDIMFKGDETDWKFTHFNNPKFIFSNAEMNSIINILTTYCKKKFINNQKE